MKILAHIGLYFILGALSLLIVCIPEEKGGMTVRYLCFMILGGIYKIAFDYVEKH